MEYTTLDKICENLDYLRKPITGAGRISGNIPYYGASGIVDYVREHIFDEKLLLVSEDGANLLARSTPIAFSIEGKAWINNHVHVLRFQDEILQKCVELYLNSISLEKYITGTAQPKLNQKMLNEIPIPIIDKEIMKTIVKTIDKLKRVIDKREEELEELGNLIKSRFVEMFGDPMLNPLGWEQTTLKDIAIGKLAYGSGASAKEYDGECRYIRITDITDSGELNQDNKSPDKYDEKYLLHDGDILFARSGATVGKTFRYSEEKHGKGIYAGYLIRLIPNKNKVMPDYVFYYTKTEYYAYIIAKIKH